MKFNASIMLKLLIANTDIMNPHIGEQMHSMNSFKYLFLHAAYAMY